MYQSPRIRGSSSRRAASVNPEDERSLYYMSVIERNQRWLEQKKRKVAAQQERMQEEQMKECTFTPVFYSRLPQVYQKFTPLQLKHNGGFNGLHLRC